IEYKTVILDEENINTTTLFNCGNFVINEFLKFKALESSNRNESKTYKFMNKMNNMHVEECIPMFIEI
ncbi:MAG: hypothetical protein ACRC8M_07095, partial [Cetobacterium sp.]|uniref:hypothetical protein n=1 Tax=Cetobacterium sp. TaxID=2071632 RepID=UPI003F3E5BF5